MKEQINPEVKKLPREVVLIDPRNPNYEGVGIGVEITTKGFNGFNIDHHGSGYTSDSPSAIEQAMTIDLAALPEGKIATVRPDPDSVGAIAVILLRGEGKLPDEKIIKAIGLADRKGPGVFKNEGAKLLGLSEEEFEKYKKIVAAARYKIVSQRTPLNKSVEFMKALLMGEISEEEIKSLYEQDQEELEKARNTLKIELICDGKVVVVQGESLRAFDIGYEHAQVVIAYNPEFKWPNGIITPKFTIARYDSNVDYFDINGLRQELQGRNPGWGGTENLIGSPQEQDPQISLEEIKEIVEKYIAK